jgi:hypothetical protein
MLDKRWIRDIYGGLSVQALVEYIDLWYQLAGVHLDDNEDTFRRWRWTTDGNYSASSAYHKMHEGNIRLQGSRRIWRNWAPPRVKFFVWLAVRHRPWTADRRRRRTASKPMTTDGSAIKRTR